MKKYDCGCFWDKEKAERCLRWINYHKPYLKTFMVEQVYSEYHEYDDSYCECPEYAMCTDDLNKFEETCKAVTEWKMNIDRRQKEFAILEEDLDNFVTEYEKEGYRLITFAKTHKAKDIILNHMDLWYGIREDVFVFCAVEWFQEKHILIIAKVDDEDKKELWHYCRGVLDSEGER